MHEPEARKELSRQLARRQPEIEQAALTRVFAVSDAAPDLDAEYDHGLRVAVGAATAYGLAAIEFGGALAPPLPPVLLAQASLAARSGVSLDTVLRRYLAGHALLTDYLVEEAAKSGLSVATLRDLLRSQASLLDSLLAAAANERAMGEHLAAQRVGEDEVVLAREMGAQLVGAQLARDPA